MFSVLILAAALTTPTPEAVLPGEQAAYQTMLTKQARDADASFAGSACETATIMVVASEAVIIGSQPDFAARRERVKVSGCGRSSVQNINVGRFGGEPPWRMFVGLPGESLADMQLQQSIWPAALAQAGVGLPASCQTLTLGDLYIAARPGHVDFVGPGTPTANAPGGRISMTLPPDAEARRADLELSQAWVEVWPLNLCGHDRTTGVVFIPLKGQASSAYVFLPVWQTIEVNGPGARPAPAPPD